MQLHSGGPPGGDDVRVHVRVHVRLHDAQGEPSGQGVDDPAQDAGLSSAGGGHQVDQADAFFVQIFPHKGGLAVIVRLEPGPDFHDIKAHSSSPVFLNRILTARFAT